MAKGVPKGTPFLMAQKARPGAGADIKFHTLA